MFWRQPATLDLVPLGSEASLGLREGSAGAPGSDGLGSSPTSSGVTLDKLNLSFLFCKMGMLYGGQGELFSLARGYPGVGGLLPGGLVPPCMKRGGTYPPLSL